MLISYKNKFIFIHNYKVAGISINIALRKYSINNPTKSTFANELLENTGYIGFSINRIIRKIPFIYSFDEHDFAINIRENIPADIWNSYFKFGVVRNPWDWQVSLYHYILKKESHWAHFEVKKCKDFNDYIESETFRIGHQSQHQFFTNENGELIVDFIAKIESLENDIKVISDKIGINIQLPHLNMSAHNKYRDYYTENTRMKISNYYKKDIELFNYSF